jgi:signal transduction histidine kinase
LLRHHLSRLRIRLLLLVIAAVLPAISLLAWQAFERRGKDMAELRLTTLNLAKLAAQAQERRIEGARQLLIALSHGSDLRRDNPGRCAQYVRRLVADYGGLYTEIGWADATGRVMCHARPGGVQLSIADRPYFETVKRTNSFAVGEMIRGRVTGALALPFAYPIRETGGALAGVAFANVDLREMSRSLAADTQAADAVIAIFDREGTVLARSVDAERWIGTRATAKQIKTIVARGELVAHSVGPDGVARLYAIATIHNAAREPVLYVSVGIRSTPLFATFDSRLRMDLLVFALLGAGILSAALAGAEAWVRRPIARLHDATRLLAEGKLDTRTKFVSGVQELENLERAFNQMAEQLERRDVHLRQGQRLEAVGQLAGGIAHDFNNLLTVIIGYAECLADSIPAESPARTELAELRAAADRAASLTQQLLAFSRRQRLQPRVVDLNEIIRQMESLMTRTLGDHIRLVTVPGDRLGIVRADPAQIEQVLLNLVLNARDAMPSGGTITIETSNVEVPAARPNTNDANDALASLEPGAYVSFSIGDTGSGMDAATRARIFEPFFSTKGSRGTGLGLATVYGIVNQSGGTIVCDSELGRGARFSIYLPRTTDVSEVSEPAVRRVSPRAKGERILCVEDQDSVRNLVRQVMEHEGYSLLCTPNPHEALLWIQRGERIDLLISDVQLPEMSGPNLYQRALAIRPGLRVLFMSGFVEGQSDLASGPAPFLPKPFTPSVLLDTVRALLDGDTTPVPGAAAAFDVQRSS